MINISTMKLQSYSLYSYNNIPQINKLSAEQIQAIELVENALTLFLVKGKSVMRIVHFVFVGCSLLVWMI